jgi:chromosome segregation ATPase
MRTAIAILIAFSFIIAGCGKSPEQIELEKQYAQLKQDLASKDHFVEDVTSTINEIHNKLENTWALEKNILRRNPSVEEGKNLSHADLKAKILDRISNISTILSENRKKVVSLQRRLAEAKTQYTGLSQMVDDLRKTLDDREKTIAQIQTRVLNLEGEISSKTLIIAARDVTIENQTKQINTAYYAREKHHFEGGWHIVGIAWCNYGPHKYI